MVLSNVFIYEIETIRWRIRPSRKSEIVSISTTVPVDLGDNPVIPINDLQADAGRKTQVTVGGSD